MSNQFNNPYSFIPFASVANEQEIAATYQSLKAEKISHDAFHDNKLSGEIHCALTTLTSLAYGNQTQGSKAKTLLPYRVNNVDAIAANSIRGLLTQHIEILTGSAAKHITNADLTYRDARAITNAGAGVIIKKDKGYYLQPIGLAPQLLGWHKESRTSYVPRKWAKVFRDTHGNVLSFADCIAVSQPIRFRQENAQTSTFNGSWCHTVNLASYMSEAIADKPLDTNLSKNEVESACETVNVNINKNKKVAKKRILHLTITEDNKQKVMQDFNGRDKQRIKQVLDEGLTQEFIQKLNNAQNGKKDFLFNIKGAYSKAPMLPIDEDVFSHFKQVFASSDLFKDHIKALKEKATTESIDEKKELLHLLTGRVVFFDVDNSANISKLADSLLWRNKSKSRVHDFFQSHQLPYHQSDNRNLSVAEQLLGVVANKTVKGSDRLAAYKSRIQVSDALFTDGQAYQTTTKPLPYMDSPKLPCTPMYFKHRATGNRQLIMPHKLSPLHHLPNGIKVYLRQDPAQFEQNLEHRLQQTDNDKLAKHATNCSLISKGNTAYFTVSFNNISPDELTLLLTALQPAEGFMHQLGSAKPFGYGLCQLTVNQLWLETAQQRYSLAALTNSADKTSSATPAKLDNYQQVVEQLTGQTCQQTLINQDMLELLKLVGCNTVSHVDYPRSNNPDKDGNYPIFQWFTKNKERGQHQTLTPLSLGDTTIKPLNKN